jgi:hypothetical protein
LVASTSSPCMLVKPPCRATKKMFPNY